MCRDLEDFYVNYRSDCQQQDVTCEIKFDHASNKWILVTDLNDQETDTKESQPKETLDRSASDQQTERNTNKVNSFGSRMRNFLNWFKRNNKDALSHFEE